MSQKNKRNSQYIQQYTNYPKSILKFNRETNPIHPTQKPIGLIKELIIKHSNSGEVLFDPFAGTNTTAAAALLTNRKFISIEKTEKYYNIGKTRIQKLSGNKLLSLNSINYISL